MTNPFAYSNYVSGAAFCNREKEVIEMLKYIRASQNVLLYSHRRYGKSSLIQQVYHQLQSDKAKIGTMHIDLYGTVSEREFISKTFSGLSQLESNFEKLIKSFGKLAGGVRLAVKMDPATGTTSISPIFEAPDEKTVLEEVMTLLERYSQKRKLVVALDEFQEVHSYTEEGFEKRLRSFIQQHSKICYIFSGSKQQIITEMFNESNQAFYKMADSFPLQKIETKHYLPWIRKHFAKKSIK